MSLNIDANLKLDVRVNGSSFDLPTKGSIDRSSEISTASLTYPNDNGRLFRFFNPYDIIEIYVGLNEFPVYPAFSGVVTSMKGSRDIDIGLHGKLWQATRRYITLTDTYNLDGMEISEAIAFLVKQLDFKFNMDFLSTGQQVIGELRDTNIDFYSLIKKLRGQVTEYNEFSEPFKYVLFEHGRKELLLRKQVDIYDGNTWFDFQYGDNLIDEYPAVKMLGVINSQKVTGKNGVESTYTHEGRASMDGLLEGKPINDTSLLTEQQCNEVARAVVEANKLPVVNTRIQHPDLIDAIPELSSVEITNAPNVIDGVYRVKRVSIDFSSGFSVKAEIEKPIPTFTEQVYESLSQLVVPYIRPVTPSSGELSVAL